MLIETLRFSHTFLYNFETSTVAPFVQAPFVWVPVPLHVYGLLFKVDYIEWTSLNVWVLDVIIIFIN